MTDFTQKKKKGKKKQSTLSMRTIFVRQVMSGFHIIQAKGKNNKFFTQYPP